MVMSTVELVILTVVIVAAGFTRCASARSIRRRGTGSA